MTIACTTQAAPRVLAMLIDARLTAGRDFRTAVSYPFGPPISFMIFVTLPASVLRALRAAPDTEIV